MEKPDAPLHALIRRAVAQESEAAIDGAIRCWEQLAVELAAIIGEGGFLSLYERSIHLLEPAYPWLAAQQSQQSQDAPDSPASPFDKLRDILQTRPPKEAGEANLALLIVFVDILVNLVGELLTANILRSAWGNACDPAAKEIEQ